MDWEKLIEEAVVGLVKGGIDAYAARTQVHADIATALAKSEGQFVADRAEEATVQAETVRLEGELQALQTARVMPDAKFDHEDTKP